MASLQVPVAQGPEQERAVPVQLPAWQESLAVQYRPSSQRVPLDLSAWVQAPVAGWQTPSSLQAAAGAQITGLEPTQLPPEQTSLCVQPFPSLQVLLLQSASLQSAKPSPSSSVPLAQFSGPGTTRTFTPTASCPPSAPRIVSTPRATPMERLDALTLIAVEPGALKETGDTLNQLWLLAMVTGKRLPDRLYSVRVWEGTLDWPAVALNSKTFCAPRIFGVPPPLRPWVEAMANACAWPLWRAGFTVTRSFHAPVKVFWAADTSTRSTLSRRLGPLLAAALAGVAAESDQGKNGPPPPGGTASRSRSFTSAGAGSSKGPVLAVPAGSVHTMVKRRGVPAAMLGVSYSTVCPDCAIPWRMRLAPMASWLSA
ncbi:MAG: hypothetical protein GMKNLPBB_02888 [Myxococcota bacterium]|nr:hypothetical protein [Myxococcota bacterium]